MSHPIWVLLVSWLLHVRPVIGSLCLRLELSWRLALVWPLRDPEGCFPFKRFLACLQYKSRHSKTISNLCGLSSIVFMNYCFFRNQNTVRYDCAFEEQFCYFWKECVHAWHSIRTRAEVMTHSLLVLWLNLCICCVSPAGNVESSASSLTPGLALVIVIFGFLLTFVFKAKILLWQFGILKCRKASLLFFC